jgi:hypothetical protein
MNTIERNDQDIVPTEAHYRLTRHLDGCYLTALLSSFQRRGVLNPLSQSGISLSQLQAFAECPEKTTGNLVGSLESLRMLGRLDVAGVGDAMYAAPTLAGLRLFEHAAGNGEPLRAAADSIGKMASVARAFTRGTVTSEDVRAFARVVAKAMEGWGLDRFDSELHWALDGVVMAPMIQMLLAPMFDESSSGIREVVPPVLTDDELHFDGRSSLSRELLGPGIEFLNKRGILVGDRCSTLGRRLVANPYVRFLAFAELSYMPTLAVLDQLLFGDIDRIDIWGDRGCDRLLNIYGSSILTTEHYLTDQSVLRGEFDERPLDEQVYGLIELGCGDGTALLALVQHILRTTARGRSLEAFPLCVVATDLSEVSVARAKEVLEPLRKERVEVFTFPADITKPDELAARIAALQIPITDRSAKRERRAQASDFLMCSSAIVQERELLIRDEEQAIEFFSRVVQRRDHVYRSVARELRIEDPTVEDIKRAFSQNYSLRGRHVPGFVVGADLAAFFERWHPYGSRGLFFIDGWDFEGARPPSFLSPRRALIWSIYWRVTYAHIFTTHYLSSQMLTFAKEFELGALLGGFRRKESSPVGYTIFRRLE